MEDYSVGDVADATIIFPDGATALVKVTLLAGGNWGIEVKPGELVAVNGEPIYGTTEPGYA